MMIMMVLIMMTMMIVDKTNVIGLTASRVGSRYIIPDYPSAAAIHIQCNLDDEELLAIGDIIEYWILLGADSWEVNDAIVDRALPTLYSSAVLVIFELRMKLSTSIDCLYLKGTYHHIYFLRHCNILASTASILEAVWSGCLTRQPPETGKQDKWLPDEDLENDMEMIMMVDICMWDIVIWSY